MKAEDFMNKSPVTLAPALSIRDAVLIMRKTKHDSFPIVNKDGIVVGMLTYSDIILQPLEKKEKYDFDKEVVDSFGKKVSDIMQKRVIAVPPEMEMNAVARLMFRSGYSKLPVVDNEGHLLGLITNTDVIRAHIERVTPAKVETLKRTLEGLHGVKVRIVEEDVFLSELIPTQGTIYLDELKAREYEIKSGLAEPLLIVKNGQKLILVDGHHRALAAKNSGLEKMHAYILQLEKEVGLGMEKTAERLNLKNLGDMKISDGLSPYTLPIVLENVEVKRIV